MAEEEKPVAPSGELPADGTLPVDQGRPAESVAETALEAGESAMDEAIPAEPAAAEPVFVDRRRTPRGPRPETLESREPLLREAGGYRLRMEPADLARLRDLPGSKGKTDRELGEGFLDGQSERLTASLAGDVEPPAEVRVVVDPYSRQAFLAVGRTIRGIVSF